MMTEIICIMDCTLKVCHGLVMGLVSIHESCEVLLLHSKPKVQPCVPLWAPFQVAEMLQCLLLALNSISQCIAAMGSIAGDGAIGLNTLLPRPCNVMQFWDGLGSWSVLSLVAHTVLSKETLKWPPARIKWEFKTAQAFLLGVLLTCGDRTSVVPAAWPESTQRAAFHELWFFVVQLKWNATVTYNNLKGTIQVF